MEQSQSKNVTMDVLIVGAGPTGLMLANLLADQGLNIRIIDENPARVQESRAIVVQARSLEIFNKIDLLEKFLTAGSRGLGITIVSDGEVAAQITFSDVGRDDSPCPYILFLSQSETEKILEENLSSRYGVTVQRKSKIKNFSQNDQQVEAVISSAVDNEENITAQYIVGCDGARSEIRKGAGLSFEGGTYEAEFMLADAKVHWDLSHDHLVLMLGHEHLGIFMPLKNKDTSRVLTIGRNESGIGEVAANLSTRSEVSIGEVEKHFQDAYMKPVQLTDPQWLSRYRVHHRAVEKMQVGRTFVAGDAAHIHSPAGGQGMNTGLQDATNLAWKIGHAIHRGASQSFLESYNSERIRIAKKLLRFTDRAFTLMVNQTGIAKKLRGFLVPKLGIVVSHSKILKRYLFGFISELNIHYHESEAVLVQGKASSSWAGKRLPDVKVAEGQTIFSITKGYRFHVLVIAKNKLSEKQQRDFEAAWKEKNLMWAGNAAIHWIESPSQQVLSTFKVKEVQVLLVRPDGYIGYESDSLNFAR